MVEFIVLGADDVARGTVTEDARYRIRRQAMMNVWHGPTAEVRRRRSKYDSQSRENAHDTKAHPHGSAPATHAHHQAVGTRLYPAMSQKGFEKLRTRYEFGITDVGSLTDIDAAYFFFPLFRSDPSRMRMFLERPHACPQTYTAYLPSRYGHHEFLDDAIACVTAQCSDTVRGSGFSSQQDSPAKWKMYGKALHSLRKAVEDFDERTGADVVCASQLLGVFELLNGTDPSDVPQHTLGVMQLLLLKGPRGFRSSFGKALIRAHAMIIALGPMIAGHGCFFGTPVWQHYFEEAAAAEKVVNQEYWWRIYALTAQLPTLLFETTGVFVNTHQQLDVYNSAVRLRQKFIAWLRRYLCAKHLEIAEDSLPWDAFGLLKVRPIAKHLHAIFVVVTQVVDRAIITLSLNALEREDLEVEAETFASKCIDWDEKTLADNRASDGFDPALEYYVLRKSFISHSIIATKQRWWDDLHEVKEKGLPGDEWKRRAGNLWAEWCADWRARAAVQLRMDDLPALNAGTKADPRAFLSCSSFDQEMAKPEEKSSAL